MGTSSNALSFNATTNNATFNGNVIIGADGVGGGGANLLKLNYEANAGSRSWALRNDDAAFGDFSIQQSTTRTGSTYATILNITSAGNIGIGATGNPSYKLYVSGNTYITGTTSTSADIALIVQNSSFTNLFYVINDGNVVISNLAGTGSRAVLADASGKLSAPVSDISVKQNIHSIGYGLNEILKMNPVWFDYIDKYKNYGQGRQNGNIAQDMESIIPEAVFITPTTGNMGINYDQLHAVYIKAIQELNEKLVRNNIN